MFTSLLVAASLAASCPETKVLLEPGMSAELKELAAQTDFTEFFPKGVEICNAAGFECLLKLYVLSNGNLDIECAMKKPEEI